MLDDPTNLARRLYAENLRLRELLAAVAQELERLAAAFSRETVWAGGVPVRGYSVRTNDWRYTEWISDGKRIARELYDHRREALETRDVAEQPVNAEIAAELSRLLARGEGWREVRQRLHPDNE